MMTSNMTIKTITSATNYHIKAVVKLHDRKEREALQLFIIEGKRALSTAISDIALEALFTTEDQLATAQELTEDKKIILLPDHLMKKISTAMTPSGLLGVFTIPSEPAPHLITPGLVLADISDPGNMGTIIRTAAACKVSTVIIIDGCDPWSPKVVQSSAGTIAKLNIFRMSWEELLAQKKQLKLYALVVKDGESPQSIDKKYALLVIGNEARGISENALQTCEYTITIAMPGDTESLNAAVAGSIATYLTFALPIKK